MLLINSNPENCSSSKDRPFKQGESMGACGFLRRLTDKLVGLAWMAIQTATLLVDQKDMDPTKRL